MMRRKKGEIVVFVVEGSGPFPFDMLRYDHCWPLREAQDSPNMAGDYSRERRRLALATQSESSPTPGRWSSFGWRFVGMGEHLRDTNEYPTV